MEKFATDHAKKCRVEKTSLAARSEVGGFWYIGENIWSLEDSRSKIRYHKSFVIKKNISVLFVD